MQISLRSAALSGLVALAAAGCAAVGDQSATGPQLARPQFDIVGSSNKQHIEVCKIGPAGSTATFEITHTGSGILPSGATFTLPANPDACVLGVNSAVAWEITNLTDPADVVTITETATSAGVTLERISTAGGLDGPQDIYPPQNWITVRADATTSFEVWFKNQGTPVEVCTDPEATNVGGPLPCVYPPEVCLDQTATNYGGPLPCVYPPEVCLDPTASNYGGPLPCVYPPPPGQGCTPGYWKASQHFDSWVGYTPNQLFSSVFANAFPNRSLLYVLNLGGGGLNALGKAAVAALLSASSGDVNYPMTTAEVIAAFNAAYASGNYEAQKDIFDTLNNAGCPLD